MSSGDRVRALLQYLAGQILCSCGFSQLTLLAKVRISRGCGKGRQDFSRFLSNGYVIVFPLIHIHQKNIDLICYMSFCGPSPSNFPFFCRKFFATKKQKAQDMVSDRRWCLSLTMSLRKHQLRHFSIVLKSPA